MDLIVVPDGTMGTAQWGNARFACALGRSGVSTRKREGDGATPVGRWRMEQLYYRPDRIAPPASALPSRPLTPLDGWCDGPSSAAYNRFVRLPHPASCERLWRRDSLYDLVVVLSQNREPPVPGAGSAIFLHVARPDYTPTEGCVALARQDLLQVLRSAGPSSRVIVEDQASAAGAGR